MNWKDKRAAKAQRHEERKAKSMKRFKILAVFLIFLAVALPVFWVFDPNRVIWSGPAAVQVANIDSSGTYHVLVFVFEQHTPTTITSGGKIVSLNGGGTMSNGNYCWGVDSCGAPLLFNHNGTSVQFYTNQSLTIWALNDGNYRVAPRACC